jgi:hypothetical protein
MSLASQVPKNLLEVLYRRNAMQGPDKHLLLPGIVKQRRSIGQLEMVCTCQAIVLYLCFGSLKRPGLMMNVRPKDLVLLDDSVEAIAFNKPVFERSLAFLVH